MVTLDNQEHFSQGLVMPYKPIAIIEGFFSGYGFKLATRCAHFVVDTIEGKTIPSAFGYQNHKDV